MQDKRLELYITFKCNNNCLFCVEKENRLRYKDRQIFKDKADVFKQLTAYKNQGYNHLNLLGGEPFMAQQISDVLQAAKGLGFKIALATNGSLLADEKLAKQCLPLIDDLIVSIHGHSPELMAAQSGNKNLHKNLLSALKNIKKYFKGRLLKANCVVNKLNCKFLPDILKFVKDAGIKEINLTGLDIRAYNKDWAVSFLEIKPLINELVEYSLNENLILRFADFPLCALGDNFHLANHLFFDQREKIYLEGEREGGEDFSRDKIKLEICSHCLKNELCQGVDQAYYELFGDQGLQAF